MKYLNTVKRSTRLIQDVYVPPSKQDEGFNIENHLHNTLDELSRQWNEHTNRKYINRQTLQRIHRQSSRELIVPITRVAPLSTLTLSSEGTLRAAGAYVRLYGAYLSVQLKLYGTSLTIRAYQTWQSLLAISKQFAKHTATRVVALLGILSIGLYPKKYTLRNGIQLDTNNPTFNITKKYALPLMGVLALLMIGVLAWPQQNITNSPITQDNKAGTGGKPSTSISGGAQAGPTKSTDNRPWLKNGANKNNRAYSSWNTVLAAGGSTDSDISNSISPATYGAQTMQSSPSPSSSVPAASNTAGSTSSAGSSSPAPTGPSTITSASLTDSPLSLSSPAVLTLPPTTTVPTPVALPDPTSCICQW